MISDNNPVVHVDEIMAKVHEAISGTRASSLALSGNVHTLSSDIVTAVARIQELLDTAESSAQVRTSLGSRLKRVPLFSHPGIQNTVLKAFAFLFRDQRNVNAAVIDALRQSLSLNVRLCEEIDQLKMRVAAREPAVPDSPSSETHA